MWIHFTEEVDWTNSLASQRKFGIETVSTEGFTLFVLGQDCGSSEPFEEEKYSCTYQNAGGNHRYHNGEVTF